MQRAENQALQLIVQHAEDPIVSPTRTPAVQQATDSLMVSGQVLADEAGLRESQYRGRNGNGGNVD